MELQAKTGELKDLFTMTGSTFFETANPQEEKVWEKIRNLYAQSNSWHKEEDQEKEKEIWQQYYAQEGAYVLGVPAQDSISPAQSVGAALHMLKETKFLAEGKESQYTIHLSYYTHSPYGQVWEVTLWPSTFDKTYQRGFCVQVMATTGEVVLAQNITTERIPQ
ncbi:MAG: hypothetical protein GX786_00335 [Clostridiales bacterium]|nr:hypothetical protein [Clostridiales bacterium]